MSDTARRLNRHEQTVRAMIRRGDLGAVRLGRLIRVLAAAVEQLGHDRSATVPAAARRAPRRAVGRFAARARA